MKLLRVDGNRDMNQAVQRLVVEIDGKQYTLTEQFGSLHIHAHEDALIVNPCCANEITVTAKEL